MQHIVSNNVQVIIMEDFVKINVQKQHGQVDMNVEYVPKIVFRAMVT